MTNPYATDLKIPVTPFPNDAHPNTLYDTMNGIVLREDRFHLEIDPNDLNPELHAWFAKYNLEVYLVELFSKSPKPRRGRNRIHSGGNGDPDKTKINWVWGGKNSVMTWYDKEQEGNMSPVDLTTPSQITYYPDLEKKNAQPIYRHQLIYPMATLVQIALPHAVENPLEARWCLCVICRDMTTKQRLGYQETLDRLKDVVVEI